MVRLITFIEIFRSLPLLLWPFLMTAGATFFIVPFFLLFSQIKILGY